MMPTMSRNQISCGTSSLPFPRTLSVHDAKGNCLTGCPRCKQCGVRRDDRRDLRMVFKFLNVKVKERHFENLTKSFGRWYVNAWATTMADRDFQQV